MKIGIICYPTVGGSGALASELGIWLAERNHEIHFISSDIPFRLRDQYHSNIYNHTVSLQHYDLFKYPPYTMALAAKISEVMRWHQLDLIHVHYAIPHAVSAFLAREMVGGKARIVTTLHGTDVTTIGKDPSYRDLTAMAVQRSCAVTAVSHNLQEKAKESLAVTKDIEVIHNFVDQRRFHPNIETKKYLPEVKEGEKIIVHVSNFRHLKRVDNTLRVFKSIQDKIPARLFLIGDGESMGSVHMLCNEFRIQDKVEFLGKQESVASLLPRCDLSLLNSEKESFGLAILEAMACGVPAVTTNIGGLPELIEEGICGYLCDPEDIEGMAEKAIHILHEDNLENFRKASIERSLKHFSIDQIGPKYEDLYKKLMPC